MAKHIAQRAGHIVQRTGVIAAMGAALIAAAPTALAESDSWDWGYEHAGDMDDLLQDGFSPASICRSTAALAINYGGEEWLDKGGTFIVLPYLPSLPG